GGPEAAGLVRQVPPAVGGLAKPATGDDPATAGVEEAERRGRRAPPRGATQDRDERRCPGGAARRATAGEHGAAVTQHHERPDVAADRRQLALERAREPRTPRRARTRPEDVVALRSCRCTLVEHNPGVATSAADVRHL